MNENYFNIPYSSSQNGLNQEIKLTNTSANVEKGGIYICFGECKLKKILYRDQCIVFLKIANKNNIKTITRFSVHIPKVL